ncbi:N-acetyl-1-D-myo-Inosityl-2-amino-2-deoxy-alpha-D-glucopyranoside deacetylase MshB [Gordonia effusa NBRC 100432]|uniref:1D-myo-inositol 2-acetamido-2-deoxy-alpha-D-glucopyranoside deacetylase n=1 Tax=Gordonia effusa NBRC 100432 TaxID=1077974 RepID=H0R1K3_9ACTN|nr:N-acetyl-1-D-myo-inositol-2-amino-2-deoxy-alpha-D-glucopyranoside deacetylase [Gordonia effusa]GAB18954.1 N-acetyl-1-D-myo-Inosityl-2-amino-2-deoxy-alpha-D-glucopyranoside deacetylase MshB [Gordonia effusa NBRC 100432]
MTAGRRLLLLHAHPDDESLMTGGTIARYLADGVDVRVLTFTLGEEGEVIGDRWAQLVADGGADQLGGLRIGELTSALAELTPPDREPMAPRFLGGAGHWRDSGMAGAPSASHPRALAGAMFDEVVATLAAEVVDFAPQVVITYDPAGTYGHPDHQTVHAASAAALPVAAKTLGAQLKVYESVTQESVLRDGLAEAAGRVPDGWRMPTAGELPSYPDARITAEIDVDDVYDRKVAALRAHATQVTVAPSGTEYALSNNILQPIGRREHFIRTGWFGLDEAPDGFETDLFAGLS